MIYAALFSRCFLALVTDFLHLLKLLIPHSCILDIHKPQMLFVHLFLVCIYDKGRQLHDHPAVGKGGTASHSLMSVRKQFVILILGTWLIDTTHLHSLLTHTSRFTSVLPRHANGAQSQ